MPNITICKNPFRPHLDRVEVVARAGTRLDTVLRREHLIAGRGRSLVRNHAFVVQVNGDWLTQDRWSRRLKADDVVLVALLPAGGGGGSNPLQIVAMVALAAVTAGAAAAWGPALGAAMGLSGTVAAGVGGALIGSAIMIGGGMLLSALFSTRQAAQHHGSGAGQPDIHHWCPRQYSAADGVNPSSIRSVSGVPGLRCTTVH